VTHFKIIIPMYNVEKWIQTTIRSVMAQTYTNYEVIIVDDISTDNSCDKVKELIGTDSRFQLVENKKKRFALENIVRGIKMLSPSESDVVVTLDGDDWFPHANVLSRIADAYETTNCLITYGTYMTYPEGKRPWNVTQYPAEVVTSASYRQDIWRASHLRTFKHCLWKNIKEEDLKDSEGNFYRMAWDLAFMFPMLEMAGPRQQYIHDVTYIYNRANPLNDDKVDHSCQLALEKEIRKKKKYRKINSTQETVYCYLKGGLANMMFQIAATISFAVDNKMIASFPNLKQHINYLNNEVDHNKDLNYADEYLKIFKNLKRTQPTGIEKIINYPLHYEEREVPEGSIILEGFFQSEKYFCHNSEEIKRIFKIPEEIKKQIQEKYLKYLDSNTTSLHIRRGDYLKFPDHHVVLSKNYYEKAIKLFPKSDFYLVFSDDIGWCKENFTGDKFVFIENEKDYVEIYLMSMCKNHIIANSSFSWWGAWLNDDVEKTVLSPKKWFGDKIKESPKDIIPEDWVKI